MCLESILDHSLSHFPLNALAGIWAAHQQAAAKLACFPSKCEMLVQPCLAHLRLLCRYPAPENKTTTCLHQQAEQDLYLACASKLWQMEAS